MLVYIAQVFIVMFSVAVPGVPLDISDFFSLYLVDHDHEAKDLTFVDKMV